MKQRYGKRLESLSRLDSRITKDKFETCSNLYLMILILDFSYTIIVSLSQCRVQSLLSGGGVLFN